MVVALIGQPLLDPGPAEDRLTVPFLDPRQCSMPLAPGSMSQVQHEDFEKGLVENINIMQHHGTMKSALVAVVVTYTPLPNTRTKTT